MKSSVLGCESGVEGEKSVGMSGYCDGKEYFLGMKSPVSVCVEVESISNSVNCLDVSTKGKYIN